MTHARLSTSLTVVVAVLLSLSGSAAQAPDSRDRLVPNFDIRLTAPRVAPPPDPDAQASLEELRRDQPGVRTRAHRFGPGVRTLHASGKPLTPPARGTPEEIARRFLGRYHRLLGLEGRDLASLAKTREYRSHNEPVAHVVFGQTVNGLQVHGSQVQFTISQRGEVLSVGNSATSVGELPEPAIGAEDAVRAAISDVRADLAFTLEAIAGPDGIERRTRFGHGPFESDIEARLVVFPMAAGARLAWEVVIEPPGLPQKYEVLIDAVSARAALSPKPGPVCRRHGACAPIRRDGCSESAAARPVSLRYAGRPGLRMSSGRQSHFAQPHDAFPRFRDGAVEHRPAAGQQHPRVPRGRRDGGCAGDALGQTAGSSTSRFRRAGCRRDAPVLPVELPARLLLRSGFRRSRRQLPGEQLRPRRARGRQPRRRRARSRTQQRDVRAQARRPALDHEHVPLGRQRLLGTGRRRRRHARTLDGDFDTDIAIHEFHHGVSNRLNTQWTGIEADAMGEGGSDFFAYSINSDTTLAEYAYPPSGIRRMNGKTYGDFYCIEFFRIAICEPHDNGEVFANVLWDLRERFRTDNVGGSNAAAIGMTHQLYVDALKLSPPSPTMLDLQGCHAAGGRHPEPERRCRREPESLPDLGGVRDSRHGGSGPGHDGHGPRRGGGRLHRRAGMSGASSAALGDRRGHDRDGLRGRHAAGPVAHLAIGRHVPCAHRVLRR